jgi:GT2 family glycosyltransferase
VRSAQDQDVPCTILVIDNHSSDDTSHWLRAKAGLIKIYFPETISLASCWNSGIAILRSISPSPILIMNNDIEIKPWTYRVLREQGKPFVTGVSVSTREQYDVGEPEKPIVASPHPDFSCFMIRSEVHYMIGPFDESYYPAYCEDLDYHVRMHRAGITAESIPLPFYHERSSALKNSSREEASLMRRGADANRERFRKKYGCLPGTQEYQDLFKV